jgi:capsule polysaccharide export protein KpsE/RkpR
MSSIEEITSATSEATQEVRSLLTKAADVVEGASARLHQVLAGSSNNEARETLAMYARLAMDTRQATRQAEAANIALGIYVGSL